jgi:hypothetical protein
MNTSRTRIRIALVLTGIWLVGAGAYIYANWPDIEALKAIDVAALAGGAVMPLAFVWLVVGFFQQGEELRNNAVALRNQTDLLAQQIEGTKSLVLVAVRQTEATVRLVQLERQKFQEETKNKLRAAQPCFVLDQGMRHPRSGSMRLHNVGAPASNLAIVTGDPAIKTTIQPSSFVQSGGFVNLHFEMPDFAFLQAELEYSDAQGYRRRVALGWTGDEVQLGLPDLEAS